MQPTTHQRLVEEEEEEEDKYKNNSNNNNNNKEQHSYSQVHAHAYAGDAHAARAWTQLFVFGRKNATLAFRNWKGSLGQLLSPVVIVVLLFGLQKLGNSILDADKPNPIPTPIGQYPHCHERFLSCKSIIYAPSNVPWVTALMQTVAERSNLDFNETFTGIENDATGIAQFQNDNTTIYNYLLSNPNRTQHAIIFTSAYIPFNEPFNPEAPMQDVGYILFYNNTLTNSYSLELMRIVDESVILLKGSANASISAQLNSFPVPPSRISGYDAVAANGGIWFYVPSMITFFILLTEIVMEKENRLRLGMRMMGLMDSVYWTIYFFTGTIFIALTTLVLIGVGAAFQFDFFLKSNFFAVFLMFFCFGLATNALAFLLSTIVGTSKTAQTLGYAIILVGFVFQIILCSGYGFLVDMLYLEDLATWVIVVRWILTFYPPYNLALAFNNIASYSSNIINISAGTITPGKGYYWNTLYEKRTSEQFGMVMNIPSNSFIYLMLLMNAGLFLILALYLDNVIPGEHGAPKPFYFFLTKSYWGFGKKKKAKEDILSTSSSVISTDIDVQQETKKAADTLIAKSDKGVQVLNLCKTYPSSIFHKSDKDVKAVDNLSLCAEEGEILCILGHNGAGKTTTINMLVGLFPPTSGIAMVYGKDVTQEMAQIQRYMGVCPQHDILWNELTAREHLLIFAQLKGVPKKAVDREILDKLGMVGLAKNSNDRVGTFSGGMKRRLSVAIAAIGEPKIIFLDEPTTGMDPVNRRSVWELIQKMKEGRVIILTTHSMEEADVLGDKISIMAHGNLCAVGNSLHLKNRFGIGYRVNVTVSEMKNKRPVTTEVKNIAPEAVLLASNAGNLTFGIPLACRDKMEQVLKYLEQKSGQEVIQNSSAYFSTNTTTQKPIVKEWGLSHTSLEDVFLEVTKRENFTYPEDGHKEQDDHAVPYDMEIIGSEKDMAKEVKKSRKGSAALRALIRKNFSLQKRQTGTNCCQIVTPILVMFILVLLQVIVRTQIKNLDTTTKINTFPWPLNVDLNDLNTSVLFSSSSLSSLSPLSSSSSFSLFDVETGYEIADDSIRQYLDEIMNPITGKPAENFLEIFSRASKPAPRFSTFSTVSKNSQNSQNPQNLNSNEQAVFPHKYRNGSNCLEFFYFTKPNSEMDSTIIGNLPATNDTAKSGLLAYISQKKCVLYNETEVNVPYFEQWQDTKTEQQSLFSILESYNTISLEDLDKAPYNYPLPDGTADFTNANAEGSISYVIAVNDNPITRYHRKNNFTRLDLNETDQYAQNGATLIVSTAQLSLMSMINDAFTQYVTNVTYSILSTKFVQLMPYTSHYDIVGLLEIFGSFLYPIALALQLPVYLYILVLEKAEKIREMMSMHGLPKWTYYLSHYIFCFILFVVVIAFFYIVGAVAHIRMFRETNFFVLSLFFFAWGNSLISMSMLLSTFISSKRVSVVVGYLVALLGSLIAIVIAIGIYNDTSRHMPVAYFIWPQFAFVRGIYLMNNACTTNYACYSLPVPRGDEYITCVVALFICSFFYYLIYLYLDQVMPREFGVPKHPLFFLRPILSKSFFEKEKEKQNKKESTALLSKEKEKDMPAKTFRDNTDVEHEKDRVTRKGYLPNAPLVIDDLAKKYPGADKFSLRSLHLAVESGECFSLLGENGAGKSTSISLLTGLYPPTRGTARIAGHDINNEMSLARLALGVCPQFNVLWDTLTVEEHLLFYARLKGVPIKEEKEHVSMWLNELGLMFASSRASSSLSGGMKRRLSVGIALVGDPKVVFLDEPTTGLDPASRRQLWTILERARPGRAIILTTHSMDEAEVLSNRIGIMALGSLRCIGTPHHLKNLVGNLFHLKINFAEHNLKLAEDFVYSLFPKASLIRTYKGTSEFHIAQDGVLVSEVFAKMEAASSDNGIVDWSFSQVGLEEVFQMVVEESHAHHKK